MGIYNLLTLLMSTTLINQNFRAIIFNKSPTQTRFLALFKFFVTSRSQIKILMLVFSNFQEPKFSKFLFISNFYMKLSYLREFRGEFVKIIKMYISFFVYLY